ncbi:MAG TPA: acetoacetate decarboxylase family protein [Polyangiaceae bacterium]|nr:acetoacetate decarboxylase family protein [Polyangiaceae bacterium]
MSVLGGTFESEAKVLADLCQTLFGQGSEWTPASTELFFDLGRVAGPRPWSFLCFRMLVRRGSSSDVHAAVTHAFIDIERIPALTVGREIFGVPALAAQFVFEGPDRLEPGAELGTTGSVSIETDVLTATSHVVAKMPIASLRWQAAAEGPPSARVAWRDLAKQWLTADDPASGPFPFVQLKQIRDAIEPADACFESLVLGHVSLDESVRHGGAALELRVHDYRSLALAKSLGQRPASESGDGAADATVRDGYSVGRLNLTFSIPAPPAPAPSPVKQSPPFRFRSGDPQFAPEYDFRGVSLTGFIIPAARSELRSLIDEQLNAPYRDRSYVYEPVSSDVIVEYIDYGSMVAAHPPPHLTIDDSAGQHELVFRVLVGRVDRGSRIAKKPAMFCPFVFVDSTWSLISGREIMGYPKELGHFARRMEDGELAACRVKSRDRSGALTEVLTIDCRRDQTFWGIDFEHDDEPQRASATHPAARPKSAGSRAHPWWGLDSLQGSADLGTIVGPWLRGLDYGFGAVLLKRFGDASAPKEACYVEILEGDYIIQNADVNLPPFRARLDFGANDPFGLKAKLGVSAHVLVPAGSWYRASCDFRVRVLDPLA